MIALISTEELEEKGQLLVKQLKNRYNDTFSNRKFILNVNRAKMKFSDPPQLEQAGLIQANQTEDLKLGSGFDGKHFDEKFQTTKKFNDWNI